MTIALKDILKKKALNEWRLFWLVTGLISIAMIIAMMQTDLSTGAGISSLIQLSVRCATPFLYLAFAASSMQKLFPGLLSMWWFRNRKVFGLCFAAAMAWQALFIVWLVTIHRDFYVDEVYVLRDVLEGLLGYSFLAAMTLTSFKFGRQRLTPKQWKWLHKVGIYSLWVYAFSVYWWALFYYPNPGLIDYVYYWGGFLTWGLRGVAWTKKRRQLNERNIPQGHTPLAFKVIGTILIGIGIFMVTFGSSWQKASEAFMSQYEFLNWLVLYLPYWPFEPYIPLFAILLGLYLSTKSPILHTEQQDPGAGSI